MLKLLHRLIFLILITSSIFSQEPKQKYLFVGHAYGSPSLNDKKIDPSLTDFLITKKNSFDKLILGGDFIQDCYDDEERQNFNLFYNQYKPYFVIGNHEMCPEIIDFSIKNFGDVNYFKEIDSNLLIFINTSFKNREMLKKTVSYVNHKIDSIKPHNVLLFTHQVIFSKNDFYLRTNSRTFYNYGNKFYNQVFEKYHNSNIEFHLFSGDIGAFPYTPFAFYDKFNNFNFYASGLGNSIHNKAILLQIGEDISVQFIDLTSGKIEPKTKYSKIKVQLFQLPKLIASRIRNVFLKN